MFEEWVDPMEFVNVSISLTPAAKAMLNKARGPMPLSTYLQLFAYCHQRGANLRAKQAQHITETALVTANNTSVMQEMYAYFEQFEAILRNKGALPTTNEVEAESE